MVAVKRAFIAKEAFILKKLFGMLFLLIVISMPMTVLAFGYEVLTNEITGNKAGIRIENVEVTIGETVFEVISELPRGVTPIVVNSDAELDLLISQIANEVEIMTFEQLIPVTEFDVGARSAWTQTFAVARAGTTFGGRVSLYTRVVTRGSWNALVIESATAYTRHTGFTLGNRWEQNNVGSLIRGRNVDAWASGTIVHYIVNPSVIIVGRTPVNLSGTITMAN